MAQIQIDLAKRKEESKAEARLRRTLEDNEEISEILLEQPEVREGLKASCSQNNKFV